MLREYQRPSRKESCFQSLSIFSLPVRFSVTDEFVRFDMRNAISTSFPVAQRSQADLEILSIVSLGSLLTVRCALRRSHP
jgi:hypothetical protein